jgi:hypothetical protein
MLPRKVCATPAGAEMEVRNAKKKISAPVTAVERFFMRLCSLK